MRCMIRATKPTTEREIQNQQRAERARRNRTVWCKNGLKLSARLLLVHLDVDALAVLEQATEDLARRTLRHRVHEDETAADPERDAYRLVAETMKVTGKSEGAHHLYGACLPSMCFRSSCANSSPFLPPFRTSLSNGTTYARGYSVAWSWW